MQNASDAASLAGTRVLAQAICSSGTAAATDAAVLTAVNDYAQNNGVQDSNAVRGFYVKFLGPQVVEYSPPVAVGSGAVPDGAVGVRVTTAITRPTYFLGFMGQSKAGAGASATAVTGPPAVAGGIRPFGLPEEQVPDPLSCVLVNFKNCDVDDPDECWIKDDNGDVIGHHRNWLNLNHIWNQGENPTFPRATGSSAGASDLKQWMEFGWTGMLYADCLWVDTCAWGDFIHAKPGTDSSIIGVTPVDTSFTIPLFDVVPHYTQIPSPKAGPVPQGGDYYYHVVGFATVRIPPGGADQGGGKLRVCIEEVIMGKGMPSPNEGFKSNSGACDRSTMTVTLWR
jgi:hypothetical protein